MTRILVVEDELKIARLIRDYLEQAGFDVAMTHDGSSALASFRQRRPDLVVLDLGLPGVDGLELTKRFRQTSDLPIVMLTARSEETDKIVGLELGADDYVTKPFSPGELVARIRAVLRRVGSAGLGAEILRAGDLEIDIGRRSVAVGGSPVDLTATEFDLLSIMTRSPGRVFTRGQLSEALLGDADVGYERTIDSHVKNLRKKVERDPRRPVIIETVYGVGYRVSEREHDHG